MNQSKDKTGGDVLNKNRGIQVNLNLKVRVAQGMSWLIYFFVKKFNSKVVKTFHMNTFWNMLTEAVGIVNLKHSCWRCNSRKFSGKNCEYELNITWNSPIICPICYSLQYIPHSIDRILQNSLNY